MYYEKLIQWSIHLEIKLEHLHVVLKKFIKITEYAREGKLHPSTISKAQLQEVITQIHTKMEDYEFPIPTLHIRAELLSPIGKADIEIASGKLLISVDVPLLDRKALQLYKIYLFHVYQNISENYTRAAYILQKKTIYCPDRRRKKILLTDKDYYDACQKTIYHTICESTQPIDEIVTTTSCKCLMLTRLSLKILQQCDVKISRENSIFWKHIQSLKAWIFSTKNPEPISITCKKGETEKGHITNSGLLRLLNHYS